MLVELAETCWKRYAYRHHKYVIEIPCERRYNIQHFAEDARQVGVIKEIEVLRPVAV